MKLRIPIIGVLLAVSSAVAGDVFYVDIDAAPNGDGLSWKTAFIDLQDGFDAARLLEGPDEVWIAEGIYYPTYQVEEENPRAFTFLPGPEISIYGGFEGWENDISQRNWDANPVILSGDLNGDDLPGWQNMEENCYLVVVLDSGEELLNEYAYYGTVIFDGIKITGGFNNEWTSELLEAEDEWRGFHGNSSPGPSAIRAEKWGFNNSHVDDELIFRNCQIVGNRSFYNDVCIVSECEWLMERCSVSYNLSDMGGVGGGGIGRVLYISGGAGGGVDQLKFVDCIFEGNGSELRPMNTTPFIFDPYTAPEVWVVNCIFRDNWNAREYAGALQISSSTHLVNCLFTGNHSMTVDCCPYGWGAGALNITGQGSTVTNCVFVGNTSTYESTVGAISIGAGGSGYNSFTLQNCVIWGNSGTEDDSIRFFSGPGPWSVNILQSSLIEGVDDWEVNDDVYQLIDCLDTNPLFVDADGPDDIYGTADDDVHLASGSPCIDRGNNTLVPRDAGDLDGDTDEQEVTPLDLDLSFRFVDVENVPDGGQGGNGQQGVVDIGVYEVPACEDCPGDRDWLNALGGEWNNQMNWYPAIPGPYNRAKFSLSDKFQNHDPYTVSLQTNVSISKANIDDDVTFDLGGNTLYTVAEDGYFTVMGGESWRSDVTLRNGSVETGVVLIGSGTSGTNYAGSLTIESDCDVLAPQGVIIGAVAYDSHLTIDGGYLASRDGLVGLTTFFSQNTVTIKNGGAWDVFFLFQLNGELALEDGYLAAGFDAVVYENGIVEGDGTIVSRLINFGEVRPGRGDGSYHGDLVLYGDYVQVDEIPVLGSYSGTYRPTLSLGPTPRLDVVGEAELGGGLIVDIADGVNPPAGEVYEILTAEEIYEQFAVALMPGFNDGRYMRIDYHSLPLLGGLASVDIVVDLFENLLGFGDPDSVPINGAPTAMTIDDFDEDGFDDVAVTLAGEDEVSPGNLLVLISDGLGGFSSSQQLAVGANPVSVTAGDFDNDGYLDLAVACAGDDTVSVIQNLATGDGTFEIAWGFDVGDEPRDVEAVDLNNDAITDLIVAASGDDVVELWLSQLGVQGGGFGNGGNLPAGDNPFDVNPGDVNNDKDLDSLIFVANRNDKTVTGWQKSSALRGGQWTSFTLAVGEDPIRVQAKDINEDGEIDVIVVNNADDTVSVILADGLGGYLPQVALPVGTNPTSLTVVDFDNDGDKDIALVATNEQELRVVQVLRNDLNLTDFEDLIFASASELASGENPAMVDHGDMDGDGLHDLVTVSEASGFRGGDPLAMISTRPNSLKYTCDGDFNFDNTVDVNDLLMLMADWGPCEGCDTDLDGDNQVAVADILLFLGVWGPCE